MNKVKLVIDGDGIGHVWLNDVEVEFVTGVEFNIKAQEPPEITIHVVGAVDAEIETKNDPLEPTTPATEEKTEDQTLPKYHLAYLFS